MTDFSSNLLAFAQVIFIDVVLSGDNAVVIGALVSALPAERQRRALAMGGLLAIVMRLIFAAVAVWLLLIPGLPLLGGVLLLWVAFKMFCDLRQDGSLDDDEDRKRAPASFTRAMIAIAVADMGMSLDNVLAVAGAASQHFVALAFGLVLSIGLMMGAAGVLSTLMQRWRWIAWIGLALILFVAVRMMYEGVHDPRLQHYTALSWAWFRAHV